jgi:hypothetical protein
MLEIFTHAVKGFFYLMFCMLIGLSTMVIVSWIGIFKTIVIGLLILILLK